MDNKLTYSELIEKYGDVELKFESYYKYSFTYRGQTKDYSQLSVYIESNKDSIYRLCLNDTVIFSHLPKHNLVVKIDGLTVFRSTAVSYG